MRSLTYGRRAVPERIRFRAAVSGEPTVVRTDPGQVHQVVMNLIVNAVDAIEEGGILRKPFTPQALIRWVTDVLGESSGRD